MNKKINIAGIKQILSGIKDPQKMAMELLGVNPAIANMIQGKNPKDVATQLMQQNGMDMNDIQEIMSLISQ